MKSKPKKRNGKYIRYDQDDKVEEWFKDGILHRENKPARIKTRAEFILYSEWYKEGKLHRENGPAISVNYDSGYVEDLYYLNGIKHTQEEFENVKAIIKLNNELNQELQTIKNTQKEKKLKV